MPGRTAAEVLSNGMKFEPYQDGFRLVRRGRDIAYFRQEAEDGSWFCFTQNSNLPLDEEDLRVIAERLGRLNSLGRQQIATAAEIESRLEPE